MAMTLAACNTETISKGKDITMNNKSKATALLKSIETGDSTPVTYINPNKYIQHNLAVGDGLAGFGAVLQLLPKDSAKVNTVRAYEDGDFVFTHTEYNFFGPKLDSIFSDLKMARLLSIGIIYKKHLSRQTQAVMP